MSSKFLFSTRVSDTHRHQIHHPTWCFDHVVCVVAWRVVWRNGVLCTSLSSSAVLQSRPKPFHEHQQKWLLNMNRWVGKFFGDTWIWGKTVGVQIVQEMKTVLEGRGGVGMSGSVWCTVRVMCVWRARCSCVAWSSGDSVALSAISVKVKMSTLVIKPGAHESGGRDARPHLQQTLPSSSLNVCAAALISSSMASTEVASSSRGHAGVHPRSAPKQTSNSEIQVCPVWALGQRPVDCMTSDLGLWDGAFSCWIVPFYRGSCGASH